MKQGNKQDFLKNVIDQLEIIKDEIENLKDVISGTEREDSFDDALELTDKELVFKD